LFALGELLTSQNETEYKKGVLGNMGTQEGFGEGGWAQGGNRRGFSNLILRASNTVKKRGEMGSSGKKLRTHIVRPEGFPPTPKKKTKKKEKKN